MSPATGTVAGSRLLAGAAWAVMLLVSDLSEILVHLAGGRAPVWLLGGKVAVLVVFLGATLAWRAVRPLRPYAVFLLVFFAALGATKLVRETEWYQRRFNSESVSFGVGYAALYVLDTSVALAVLGVLWALKRRPREFFLAVGDLDAPVERVRSLGIRGGEPWTRLALVFAFAAGLCVFFPTVLALRPSSEDLRRALTLLPAVLLFSAVNAFNEEVYFRASFLATLAETIGRTQTLLVTIVFFGLSHFLWGSPSGIPGAAMTGFLAYLLGKSMLETRGMLCPWFIHFVPDVVVFSAYAILFVRR